MKEGKISCNYIIKELEDLEELYKVEVMANKALELAISELVNNQVCKSKELKKEIKKIQYINNAKRFHARKNVESDKKRIKQLND